MLQLVREWVNGYVRCKRSDTYTSSVIGKQCSFICYLPTGNKKISLEVRSFSKIYNRTGTIYRLYFNTNYTRFLEIKVSKYGNVMIARYIHRDVSTDRCSSNRLLSEITSPTLDRSIEINDKQVYLTDYNLFTYATEYLWYNGEINHRNHTKRTLTAMVAADMNVYVEIDSTAIDLLRSYRITHLDYNSIRIS